jgi:hypothetical protein
MRIQTIQNEEYVPNENIQWGNREVSAHEPLVSTIYASQGIYAWEDGIVTEGREVVKMRNPHAVGYYRWRSEMYLGEVYRANGKWHAYDRGGEKVGLYTTKTAAANALYDLAREQRAEQVAA